MRAHTAVAVVGLNEPLVLDVLNDWKVAPVREPLRAMLGFLEKLNLTPDQVTPEDIKPLRTAGLSDQAIEEAIYVTFVFNVLDRLADTFGFTPSADTNNHQAGKFLYRFGYSTSSIPG